VRHLVLFIGNSLICKKKELAARDYPPSLIFSVDETGLTVVQRKQPKILALKSKRQPGAVTAT
jgi:hypothetical protein